LNPLANVINFSASQPGSFSLIGSAAFTNTPGDATGAMLGLNYAASSVGGLAGGTATISTSANGFLQPPQALNPLTLLSHIGGTGNQSFSLTADQWANPDNSLFGMTGPSVTHGPFTGSPYSDDKTVLFNRGPGPFSLTDQITVTLGANSAVTGGVLSAVPNVPIPEPTSILVMLGVLPILALRHLYGRTTRTA
jgi:hypothetical protein